MEVLGFELENNNEFMANKCLATKRGVLRDQ